MESQIYQTENEMNYVSLDFNPLMRKAIDHLYSRYLTIEEVKEN